MDQKFALERISFRDTIHYASGYDWVAYKSNRINFLREMIRFYSMRCSFPKELSRKRYKTNGRRFLGRLEFGQKKKKEPIYVR